MDLIGSHSKGDKLLMWLGIFLVTIRISQNYWENGNVKFAFTFSVLVWLDFSALRSSSHKEGMPIYLSCSLYNLIIKNHKNYPSFVFPGI